MSVKQTAWQIIIGCILLAAGIWACTNGIRAAYRVKEDGGHSGFDCGAHSGCYMYEALHEW